MSDFNLTKIQHSIHDEVVSRTHIAILNYIEDPI